MNIHSAQYLIGIDLGTTHTVVAYAPIKAHADISLFHIEQLVAPGQVMAKPLLPSVRYHPAPGELSAEDSQFSPTGEQAIIGLAARVLGAKTKGRFISSAKSWLSHPNIDQNAKILPWGSAEEIEKIAPVDACASYLKHIRVVWQHQFPDAPLEQQDIIITVPASFDEAARALTLEAANLAGITNARLLEEPQAVCYDWLRRNNHKLKHELTNVHLLLVCDIGGGTTDLTLIKIDHNHAEPVLTRIGVGDHLMLGGDNIDLALAHLAESRLKTSDKRLSAAEFSQLLEQCRQAKEILLAATGPETANVTLLGGGAKLIGNTRSVEFTKAEVNRIALDGFFPLTRIDELPDKKRSGIVEFGLPYAHEPAISKHIAAFLTQHKNAAQEALAKQSFIPDALLLNGGVFRSQPISQRLVELMHSWQTHAPIVLDNPHPELAVAFGAVSYAIARQEKSLKIGGGSARSYFLLIATDYADQHGVCILPKGSEEGHEIILQHHQFLLRLGSPVRFHLASISSDTQYSSGDIIAITDHFHLLPPLAVALEHQTITASNEVIVHLAVTQTELGTLKIQCVAIDNSQQRWDVEFQIRAKSAHSHSDAEQPMHTDTLHKIEQKILMVYGTKSKQADPNAVKNLRTDLEKLLGKSRHDWDVPLLRVLFGQLMEGAKYQRRSAHHERTWLSLIGFCMRPGFGYPLDDWRVTQLWQRYALGIQFVNETQNWTEWWTLWRRIAGGLDEQAQEALFVDIADYINPATARQPGIAKQLKIRSYEDIVRLSAVLERLPAPKKIQLGTWLLQRLEKSTESAQTWWAVGRIGVRVPFHGSQHNVIEPSVVSEWLSIMLKEDWKKSPHIGFAATLIARMSGDRARDIDSTLREHIITKLKLSKTPLSWIALVEQLKELDEKEEKQLFGEALPPGLKLINNTKS